MARKRHTDEDYLKFLRQVEVDMATGADAFAYSERFYFPKRRHPTIGNLSLMEFERQAGFA